jgi:hypothetical protein
MAQLPDLFTTLAEPAPYVATAIVAAPSPDWLDLPGVLARLQPLAEAAGHERLLLVAHLEPGQCYYEASATGGPRGFVTHIGYFDYGSAPAQFERCLRELLTQAAQPALSQEMEVARG